MRWLCRLLRLEKQTDIEDETSETWLADLENVAMSSQHTGGSAFVVRALLSFARIQMALSRRAHKQTHHVIGLTWAIVLLTFGLLVFTIYLAEDAYFKNQRAKEKQSGQTEPDHSGFKTQLTIPY